METLQILQCVALGALGLFLLYNLIFMMVKAWNGKNFSDNILESEESYVKDHPNKGSQDENYIERLKNRWRIEGDGVLYTEKQKHINLWIYLVLMCIVTSLLSFNSLYFLFLLVPSVFPHIAIAILQFMIEMIDILRTLIVNLGRYIVSAVKFVLGRN